MIIKPASIFIDRTSNLDLSSSKIPQAGTSGASAIQTAQAQIHAATAVASSVIVPSFYGINSMSHATPKVSNAIKATVNIRNSWGF